MSEGIKVTDKRMFDSEGRLREEPPNEADQAAPEGAGASSDSGDARERAPAEEPASTQAPDADPADAPTTPRDEAPPGAGPEALPEPEVMDLIGLIAQPISLFLGDARLPDGGSAENLALARYHIDLLELLRAKTQGNLSRQEEQVLADLLYQLRMRYVEKAG